MMKAASVRSTVCISPPAINTWTTARVSTTPNRTATATSFTKIGGFRTTVQEEQISAAVVGQAIPQADVRDYRENELPMRVTYDFNLDLSLYVEGELTEDVYDLPVTTTGLTRDMTGFLVLAGTTFAFSDAFYGDIRVGWGEQSSIADDTAPIEGVLFNAGVVWMPTPMTLIELIATSSVNTLSTLDSLGAISRSYRLSLQQAFWRYLVVGGYLSYEVVDYVDNPLVDERMREGLTLDYFFNPNKSVYPRYGDIRTSCPRSASANTRRTKFVSACAPATRYAPWRSEQLLDLGDHGVA